MLKPSLFEGCFATGPRPEQGGSFIGCKMHLHGCGASLRKVLESSQTFQPYLVPQCKITDPLHKQRSTMKDQELSTGMHRQNAVALFVFNFDIWMEEVHHLKVAIRGLPVTPSFLQSCSSLPDKDYTMEGWGCMEKFLKFILPKVTEIIRKLLKVPRSL